MSLRPQVDSPNSRMIPNLLSSRDEEKQSILLPPSTPSKESQPTTPEHENESSVSKTGLCVLALLASQNCFKNLLMRYVMVDQPAFLLSTAVITTELLKLFFSSAYILCYSKQSLGSIYQFIFIDDWKNSLLLICPAICYSLQMTLEYIAFANINAAEFSVIVQLKLLFAAFFFRTVLGKKLKKKQVMSLVLLTVGVMLCNMKMNNQVDEYSSANRMRGIMATGGIAVSSGFASVYTEKVIKSSRKNSNSNVRNKNQYGLAYMQCQLAVVSLFCLGLYAFIKDSDAILKKVSAMKFVVCYTIMMYCVFIGSGDYCVLPNYSWPQNGFLSCFIGFVSKLQSRSLFKLFQQCSRWFDRRIR